MDGVLVVDKPKGLTSHDVVNQVRRLAGTRQVGHTGTLDPLATGVLVLLIGRATRLAQFMTHHDKCYQAVIRFGETTTTYDLEGEVVTRSPVALTLPQIEVALCSFRGELAQIPPMYSAIKVKGQKLYRLARNGEQIERAPRPVVIHSLDVLQWQPPDLTVEISCSAGTYIRSVAHDLGQALGCGAHLAALTRTASGQFQLAQTYTLEALGDMAARGVFSKALLPARAALGTMPAVVLDPAEAAAVRNGQTIALSSAETAPYIQAHDERGQLVAVMIPDARGWRPTVVIG